MNKPDTPNVVLPLGFSYNERNNAGFTATITNANDQRKVNAIYEPVKNALTGSTTLYTVKRPGVSLGDNNFGVSGQVAYLVSLAAGSFGVSESSVWVYSTSGNDVRVSNSSGTTTVIVTAAGHAPAYVGKTAISGTDTVVLQTRNPSTGAQRAFYSSAIATWTEITLSALTEVAGQMQFMDGWSFLADSSVPRIHNSDLNALTFSGAYITKQISQDSNRGLARLGKQIICFGTETAEVFVNAGTETGSPLRTVPDLFDRIGISSQNVGSYTHYYATLGKKMYFVGRRSAPDSFGCFMFDGQSFIKVSTPFIDKILNERSDHEIFAVYRSAFYGKEAISIALTGTTATTQRWLMYFPDWNDWFEWDSTVFTPVNNGIWYLGVDQTQNRVYRFNTGISDVWQDAGTNYTRTLQFEMPTDGNQRKFMRWCGLKGTVERSACTETVLISDDDGQNWTTLGTIDRTALKQHIYRCGSYRKRLVRLTNATNHHGRLESFLARVD